MVIPLHYHLDIKTINPNFHTTRPKKPIYTLEMTKRCNSQGQPWLATHHGWENFYILRPKKHIYALKMAKLAINHSLFLEGGGGDQ